MVEEEPDEDFPIDPDEWIDEDELMTDDELIWSGSTTLKDAYKRGKITHVEYLRLRRKKKKELSKRVPLCKSKELKCSDRAIVLNDGYPDGNKERVKMFCMSNPSECPLQSNVR